MRLSYHSNRALYQIKHKRIFLMVLLLSIVTSDSVFAQKTSDKALGLPDKINPPQDYFDNHTRYLQYIQNDLWENSRLSRDKAWIVFSDREDNPVYEKDFTTVRGKLKFADACIVINQNLEWIEVVKGKIDGLGILAGQQYLGWVKKDKMLLWSQGLTSSRTGIHQKAFLLNKADAVESVLGLSDKERVPIYNGPGSSKELVPSKIYRYFFVYKKENNRLLLAEEYQISPDNVKLRLLGWVPESRCETWNTRLAFEPNINKESYDERKGRPDKFRLAAYGSAQTADLHAKSGIISASQVEWDNDPVKANPSMLATSNPYRYKGSVIRFPMLSSSTSTLDNVIRTGIVGDVHVKSENGKLTATIPEHTYATTQEHAAETRTNTTHFNILYVIEGTAQMALYKSQIMKFFKDTKQAFKDFPNTRIGAVIYRDISERVENKDIEILPLTKNESQYARFVESILFTSWHDADEYTNVRDAIYRGVEEGGFDPDQTNIIVVLGSGPDFYSNRVRKASAEAENDPAVHSTHDVVNMLSKVDASIFFIQCQNNADNPALLFKRSSESVIHELAMLQYNKTLDIARQHGLALTQPITVENPGSGLTELKHGALPGFLAAPKDNSTYNESDISMYTTSAITTTRDFITNFNQVLAGVIEDGESLEDVSNSAGDFSPAMAKWLTKLMREKSQAIGQQDVGHLMQTKYQLYKDMYIPYHITGAKHPTVSYVLFMPASDLDRYIRKLQIVEKAGNAGTETERRETLFDAFKQLIHEFTGNSGLSDSEISQMTIKQFQALMNGVKAEGLRTLPGEQNFILGDILNSKETTREEVDALINRLIGKLTALEKILQKGASYEFAFNSGQEVYFWITLDESF